MKRFSPWGYKIDYDKEIAQDEAQIAELQSEGVMAAAATLKGDGQPEPFNALEWIYWCQTVEECLRRGEAFGLSHDQTRMLGAWIECESFNDGWDKVDRRVTTPLQTKLQAIWVGKESDRKAFLAKAKSALSRHKRNKTKHG